MDGLVPAEPCQLTLGVAAGGLAHQIGGFLYCTPAVKSIHEFLVADGLHGGGLFGNAVGEKPLNFLHQPLLKHETDPQIDTAVQLAPLGKVQPQPDRGVPGRNGLRLPVVFRNGLAGLQINLQRPEDALPVGKMQTPGGVGVYGAQTGKHGFHAIGVCLRFQPLPDTGGGEGGKGVAPDEGIHVKPGPACDHSGFSPGKDIVHNGGGHITVAADGKILPRLGHVDHVVGDSLHFLQGGLRGADVHALIHLHGVAGHHFTIQFLRQCCGQRGFPRGCRPGDADDVVHK